MTEIETLQRQFKDNFLKEKLSKIDKHMAKLIKKIQINKIRGERGHSIDSNTI